MGETWLCPHGNDRPTCRSCAEGKQTDAELAAELLKGYEKKGDRTGTSIDSSPIILDKIIDTVETDRLEGSIGTLKDANLQVSDVLQRLRKAMENEKRTSFIRVSGGTGTKSADRTDIDVFRDALLRLDNSDREEVAKMLRRLAS
jgi:hypothetical protein